MVSREELTRFQIDSARDASLTKGGGVFSIGGGVFSVSGGIFSVGGGIFSIGGGVVSFS